MGATAGLPVAGRARGGGSEVAGCSGVRGRGRSGRLAGVGDAGLHRAIKAGGGRGDSSLASWLPGLPTAHPLPGSLHLGGLREGLTEGGLARLVWGITGEKPEEPGAVAAAPSGHRALPSNLKTTRARWSWGIGLSLLGAPRPHRRKTGNGDPLVRRDWRSQGPRYRRLLGGPVLPGRRILEQGGRKTGKSDAEIKTAIEALAPTAPKKE